jgi:hypothetical protein
MAKAKEEKAKIVGKCADCFYARSIGGIQRCRDIQPGKLAYTDPNPAECGRHITPEEHAALKAKKAAEKKAREAAEKAKK